MDKCKVSVIVPVYNVEKFLPKCIDSILHQEFENIEVILVDDGSKDRSGFICDEYAEKDLRIKVIHKENSGVSNARNTGIETATGEWICFVDGDDFIMPDYIQYMFDLALKNKADIALTKHMFGNFDNKQVEEDVITEWNSEDAIEAILCYRVPIGCYCKLFKATLLNNVRFIPDVFIGEGFNFNVDAFQKAKKIIAGEKKTYYYRRDNPNSAMTKFSVEKCECGLKALDVIKDNLTIKTDRMDRAWRFANWRTHSDFYDMCVLAKAQESYPELYKRCYEVTKKEALSALKVPASKQNKIRAIVMKICPALIPLAMRLRNRRYNIPKRAISESK